MKQTKVRLLSIDPERCQALVPNGNTFMALGGVPGLIRCENRPCWVAIQKKEYNGECSGMSLCEDCKKICETKMPGLVTFQILGRE